MGVEPFKSFKSPAVEDFISRLKSIREEAKSALEKARLEMKRYADKKRKDVPSYKKGDKVMLSTEHLKINVPSSKLGHKWIRPYEVMELVGPNALRLKLPKTLKIHDVINVSRLTPYTTPGPGQRKTPLPPIEIEGEEEYEVEKILDHQVRRGKNQFLIK